MRFVRLISLLTAALAVSACFAAAPTDPPVPVYELHRWIETGRIETLIVVVWPGSYSNDELEKLAYYIVEGYGPREALVVDTSAAAELAKLAKRTDEQQAELNSHALLSINNGVEVTFHGPYADLPELTEVPDLYWPGGG